MPSSGKHRRLFQESSRNSALADANSMLSMQKRSCVAGAFVIALFIFAVSKLTSHHRSTPATDFQTLFEQTVPPDYSPIILDDYESKDKPTKVTCLVEVEPLQEFASVEFFIPDAAKSVADAVYDKLIGGTYSPTGGMRRAPGRRRSRRGRRPPASPSSTPCLDAFRYFDEQAVPSKKRWDNIDEQLLMTRKEVVGLAEYKGLGDALYEAMDRFPAAIKGKTGAVIGSRNPWVEVFAFKHGAESIMTVEYQQLDIRTSKNLTYIHPNQFADSWRQFSEVFDFVVSFSSIEHSGLGRYGDALDPWGDVREIAKVRCALKPGGIFILGLPIDNDALYWNAHRLYGVVRLPWILKGFKMLGAVMTLSKEDPTPIFAPGIPVEYVLGEPKTDSWLWQQPAIVLQKV